MKGFFICMGIAIGGILLMTLAVVLGRSLGWLSS